MLDLFLNVLQWLGTVVVSGYISVLVLAGLGFAFVVAAEALFPSLRERHSRWNRLDRPTGG
jgi:hypothetical protein